MWMSPPCGTFSKARNRPLPASLLQAGVPPAPQLRSNVDLWGLPSALNQPPLAAKVFEANILLEFACEVILTAAKSGRDWVMCNPRGSFVWDLPFWKSITFYEVVCDRCAYGGERPAPFVLRTSCVQLQTLERKCDGKHQHAPWQPIFDNGSFKAFTSRKNASLPKAFCSKAAEVLGAQSHRSSTLGQGSDSGAAKGMPAVLGLAAKVQSVCSDENKRKVATTAAAAGRQARGKRVDRLIAEYKDTIKVTIPQDQAEPLSKRKRLEAPLTTDTTVVPKDSQVIDITTRGETSESSVGLSDVEFGVPWSAEEFSSIATQLKHPYSTLAVSKEISSAVFACAVEGPSEIANQRKAYIDKWATRGVELLDKEAELIASLHVDVQPFARKKRVLLFHEMLKDAGFAAADLCLKFLMQGVPMFGVMPHSSVFPGRPHEAFLSKSEVIQATKWALPAILGTKIKDPNTEAQQKLWKVTEEEELLGECRGPFTREQMDAKYPQGWAAAPRFPVEQKSKVRPCDNYTVYGHNGTSEDTETIDTEGPDSIAGLAKLWTRIFEVDEFFNFRLVLDDGSVMSGTLHPELRSLCAQELLGRLIDLARAYKQLARDPVDADMAIFCLPYLSGGATAFFEAVALGFGARNAVKGFNLFARGLRHLIVVGLLCPATHFFDYFSHIDARPFSRDSCDAVEALFKLLGWEFKSSPEDLKPPAAKFSPLGVEIDLSIQGAAVMGNTAKRKDKILHSIRDMRGAQEVHPRDIQSLVGVCLFADSYTAGRSGSLVLRDLRRTIGGSREKRQRVLEELEAHIIATKPRIVCLRSSGRPVTIFTDAAADDKGATFGAVCIDHASSTFEFFAGCFSADQVSKWSADISARMKGSASSSCAAGGRRAEAVRRQVICQAELAVIPIALATWESVVAHRDVLCFIDNDAAKDALILGTSSSEWSSRAVRRTRSFCAELAAAVWYERVPSPSNIADWPSRGDVESLLALGARRVLPLSVSGLHIEFHDL